jgi:hypothetical protein
MKIRIVIVLAFLTGIISIYSCEKNSAGVGGCPEAATYTNLTYTNTMQAIITSTCASSTSCHAVGGLSLDFTTYKGLRADATGGKSSKMWDYLFIRKTMPLAPTPALDICTQAKFQAWLNAGAPQ